MDAIDKLLGKSIGVLNYCRDTSNKQASSTGNGLEFFKSYASFSDAAFRAGSVVCAPIILACLSAFFGMITTACLASALFSLVTCNSSGRFVSHANEGRHSFLTSLQFAFLALTSPLINAVDIIGGGINTIKEMSKETNDDAQYTTSPTN